jgi:pilus assembly protein TadC
MFYFKTISIDNASPQLIEKAIQDYTIKRNSYLDFIITSYEFHDNKFFSRLETNNEFLLIRMKDRSHGSKLIGRTSKYYRNIPTVIIRFKKDKEFSSYQLRLGFFTTLICCILSLAVIICSIFWLKDSFDSWEFFVILVLYVSLLVGTFMEIDLTRKYLNKIIQKALEHESF